jgi:hypothetical protein
MYSGSKFTNWARFDPFVLEINAIPDNLPPESIFETQENEGIKIYSLEVQAGFVRPFDSKDVAEYLKKLPEEFLQGIVGIYLLGGTKKQMRASFGSLFRYGCYWGGDIYLHAFPEKRMTLSFMKKQPNPSILEEYRRANASIKSIKGGLNISFDIGSLKSFFLRDVLMHEIGHHVDRGNADQTHKRSERFAEWFASEYGYRLPIKSTG